MTRTEAESHYDALMHLMKTASDDHLRQSLRLLCTGDLYFLLTRALGRSDMRKDWLYDRCNEVQKSSDGHLDLWSREHYKLIGDEINVTTPSGIRKHGDLKPGDFVYSPDGNPVRVIATTGALMDPDMYEVTFCNAQRSTCETIVAGGDHLWDVQVYDARRKGNGRVGMVERTLATKDIFAMFPCSKPVRIPYCKPFVRVENDSLSKDAFWYITDIKKTKTVQGQCIQVDGGRYVVGNNNIPTHNSTIITFGQTILDILNNPEVTIGIFSHTRPIAKGFLRQIKREFEGNEMLHWLFPDILYAAPHKESPKWSEDDGIVIKRSGNPKEATVEAWGLVDGQPTGKHFSLMVYDDVVTRESVTTPEMIRKVTEAWGLSRNLGAEGGRVRYIGTRYHTNDTYKVMMDREAAIPRIYPATDNGQPDGNPVLLSQESLERKRREMGPFIFASQMLQDPTADAAQGFKREWLRHTKIETTSTMNLYILCDPASEKKKESDYTVMLVVGLGADENYYVVDMVRDRLNLTERGRRLMQLHRQYRPSAVGYEKYGLQADIEFVEYLQQQENYRFHITQLGGQMPKNDRIRRMIPLFEQGRVYLPLTHYYVDYEGRSSDLVRDFVEQEYSSFPVSQHDDMLDCLARITDADINAVFPRIVQQNASRRRAKRSAMVV